MINLAIDTSQETIAKVNAMGKHELQRKVLPIHMQWRVDEAHDKQCDICGSRYMVALHHHIKQQWVRIDLAINTSHLCRQCHGVVDNGTLSQLRKLLDKHGLEKLPIDYFRKLKGE
jgi:hypothetical protein